MKVTVTGSLHSDMKTAKEAFEISTARSIDEVYLKIEAAISLGQFEITIPYGIIPCDEFSKLRELGYQVSHIQASYTRISWKDAYR